MVAEAELSPGWVGLVAGDRGRVRERSGGRGLDNHRQRGLCSGGQAPQAGRHLTAAEVGLALSYAGGLELNAAPRGRDTPHWAPAAGPRFVAVSV